MQKNIPEFCNEVETGDVSIVIGASSVIIECLSHNIKVFQLVSDNFEIYDTSIWEELIVTKVNEGILCYQAKKNINYFFKFKKEN